MDVQPNTPNEWMEVCLRWSQALRRANVFAWREIAHWLAAEAIMARLDGGDDAADDMTAASDLAYRHYLDLMPQAEVASR